MDSQFQLSPLEDETFRITFAEYTEAENEALFVSSVSEKPYAIRKVEEHIPVSIVYQGMVYENCSS